MDPGLSPGKRRRGPGRADTGSAPMSPSGSPSWQPRACPSRLCASPEQLPAASPRRCKLPPVELPGTLAGSQSLAWRLVLDHLGKQMREGYTNLEAPSTIIRRHLLLGQTCQELHAMVLTEALPALAARVPVHVWGEPFLPGDSSLNAYLGGLRSCSPSELQAHERELAGLLQRSLGLGPGEARGVPVALLAAVRWERAHECPYGANLLMRVTGPERLPCGGLPRLSSLFSVRAWLTQTLNLWDDAGWERFQAAASEAGWLQANGR